MTNETISAKVYSLGEEIANSITHGIGALLSVAGLTLLVAYAVMQNDVWRIVSFSVYGASLVMLFLASTLYHAFTHEPTKRVFKLLDHCAIYFLIAGTYTPFLLVSMREGSGWLLFIAIWGLALVGVAFKLVFKQRFKKISVFTYLIMGWLIVLASSELVETVAMGGVYLLVAGGLAYSVGVIFYVGHRIPYNHAIWHLFVLAGSVLHFFSVFYYVLPAQAV